MVKKNRPQVQHHGDNFCRESRSVDSGEDFIEHGTEEIQEEVNPMDTKFTFEIAHKKWSALYNHEGPAKLEAAMMRHLYKQKFGQEAMDHAYDMCELYIPLSL